MFFQSANIFISSGFSGNAYLPIDKATDVSLGYSIQRRDTEVLGKSRPLENRNIDNFIPVKYSFDYIKNDKDIESSLGLLNTTGAAYRFSRSNSIIGQGCRNILISPIDKTTNLYDNQLQISSGILQNYSLSASVGQAATVSIAGEGLSLSINSGNSVVSQSTLQNNTIKAEKTFVTGIAFSGFGITGMNIQDLSIGITYTHQPILKMGYRYPEYQLVNAKATVSINGYIEGIIPTFNTAILNNGLPEVGSFYLTLQPACSNAPATTYIIRNPYLDSFNLGLSVGSYISTQLSFSIPLPFTEQECLTGSNLIII
jgi:hypothetical protein